MKRVPILYFLIFSLAMVNSMYSAATENLYETVEPHFDPASKTFEWGAEKFKKAIVYRVRADISFSSGEGGDNGNNGPTSDRKAHACANKRSRKTFQDVFIQRGEKIKIVLDCLKEMGVEKDASLNSEVDVQALFIQVSIREKDKPDYRDEMATLGGQLKEMIRDQVHPLRIASHAFKRLHEIVSRHGSCDPIPLILTNFILLTSGYLPIPLLYENNLFVGSKNPMQLSEFSTYLARKYTGRFYRERCKLNKRCCACLRSEEDCSHELGCKLKRCEDCKLVWYCSQTCRYRDQRFHQHECIKIQKKCSWCSETKSLKKCAGCKEVRYCSHECQRNHWEESHKNECVRQDKETS